MIAAPPPTIVAAVKAAYPRTSIRVEQVCTVDRAALVRLRVKDRETYIVLERPARRWHAVWVDGAVLHSVPSGRRTRVAAEVRMLKTRCLAP